MRDTSLGQHRPKLHMDWIDPDALDVVKRLQKAGFKTYLVGGCVRDLLAGIHPKDFDIATTAAPEDVRRVIRQAYVIGRRFRLVLVKREGKQFEVATFRREATAEELSQEDISADNFFGTEEEDAKRRDFPINALFYDPVENDIVDYCGGLKDIEDRVISCIGDPEVRIKEDPIRILRAIRLSHKLKFKIHPDLRAAILRHSSEVSRSVLPRRREEILKILRLYDPTACLHELFDLDILKHLSPTLNSVYENPEKLEEFEGYLHKLHELVRNNENPAELFGGLLLAFYRAVYAPDPEQDFNPMDLVDDPVAKKLFRDELGMSNFEQRVFIKALALQNTLRSVDRIRTRGERRQFAVISSDSFPLALSIARIDHLISGPDFLFWKNLYTRSFHKIADLQKDTKRRPRPRRRDRGPRDGAKKPPPDSIE
jgi:poly(A) polymerase